jgi:hypothetical protein
MKKLVLSLVVVSLFAFSVPQDASAGCGRGRAARAAEAGFVRGQPARNVLRLLATRKPLRRALGAVVGANRR